MCFGWSQVAFHWINLAFRTRQLEHNCITNSKITNVKIIKKCDLQIWTHCRIPYWITSITYTVLAQIHPQHSWFYIFKVIKCSKQNTSVSYMYVKNRAIEHNFTEPLNIKLTYHRQIVLWNNGLPTKMLCNVPCCCCWWNTNSLTKSIPVCLHLLSILVKQSPVMVFLLQLVFRVASSLLGQYGWNGQERTGNILNTRQKVGSNVHWE